MFKPILSAFLFLTLSQTFAASSPRCPDESGYYYTNYNERGNPREGGFVSYTAFVDSTTEVWVGKNAAVCGFAEVVGRARVMGNAVVKGNAYVSGSNVTITGDAIVKGNVTVTSDNGRTRIMGFTVLDGNGVYDGVTINETDNDRTRDLERDREREEAKRVVRRFYNELSQVDYRLGTSPFYAQSRSEAKFLQLDPYMPNPNNICQFALNYTEKAIYSYRGRKRTYTYDGALLERINILDLEMVKQSARPFTFRYRGERADFVTFVKRSGDDFRFSISGEDRMNSNQHFSREMMIDRIPYTFTKVRSADRVQDAFIAAKEACIELSRM